MADGGAVRRGAACRRAADLAAVGSGDDALQRQDAVLDGAVDADRDLAAAVDGGQKGPFGRRRSGGAFVIEEGQGLFQRFVVCAGFDGQGALADGGNHRIDGQELCDAVGPAQALQTGFGQDDGVVLAVVELLQARVDVAPQIGDEQVRPGVEELGLAAQARRADTGTGRQGFQGRIGIGNEGVVDMVAGRNGCQAEAVRDVRRQVLQTVDGQVDGAVQEALFQFCREQTFAADAGQRDIEDFVALRDDVLELDGQFRVVPAQGFGDVVGLPQGQLAAPRTDSQITFHGFSFPRRPAASGGGSWRRRFRCFLPGP